MKLSDDFIVFHEENLTYVGNSDKMSFKEFIAKVNDLFETRFGQEIPLGTYYGRNKYNDFVGVVEVGIWDAKKILH